jgi:hypothetical protein
VAQRQESLFETASATNSNKEREAKGQFHREEEVCSRLSFGVNASALFVFVSPPLRLWFLLERMELKKPN